MSRIQHDVLEVVMDGHLVPASSNSDIRCFWENFTLDAERWLSALYWCVRTSYGDDAAHAAADCWLRVFGERFEGGSRRPLRFKSSPSRLLAYARRFAK